jgi:hypothetical protein
MITTITLWLLINIGGKYGYSAQQTAVVERFATAQECERVASILRESSAKVSERAAILQCVQATVVKP